jgi:2,3-bisphosphoglycerate-independent phosphoglycerate mutase
LQNLPRIDTAIANGEFDNNPTYIQAIDKAIQADKAVHIMGLLSPGGVHSHEHHLMAALDMAAKRGARKLFLHAFLDGRDTPPRSAHASIELVEKKLKSLGVGRIASLCGRYYAMDRDLRWERTMRSWLLLIEGKGDYQADDATTALNLAYQRGEDDEFVAPTLIQGSRQAPGTIKDGDSVLFMNFRPDRARQLTQAFVDPAFTEFAQNKRPELSAFVMTTNYSDRFKAPCAFASAETPNSLGEYLSSLNKRQLRIAETEKYAHVTFFFSAGHEDKFPGEDRILIPSPHVATYDLQPEMSANQVSEQLIKAINSTTYDVIICNFANGDMVGHTGVFNAAIEAVEVLDNCLGQIIPALTSVGGQCLITADHGNIEHMRDRATGLVVTSHTTDPVPLVYVGPRNLSFVENGCLADIAPTMLALLNLTPPAEMTGISLLAPG